MHRLQPPPAATRVARKFQEQMCLCIASVAQIELDDARPAADKLGPPDGARLTSYEQQEKLELDSTTNAAAYTDPATNATLTSLGGRKDDARSQGWKHLKRMLRVCNADADAGAALGFAVPAADADVPAADGPVPAAGGAAQAPPVPAHLPGACQGEGGYSPSTESTSAWSFQTARWVRP